jgi:hypothetical protein
MSILFRFFVFSSSCLAVTACVINIGQNPTNPNGSPSPSNQAGTPAVSTPTTPKPSSTVTTPVANPSTATPISSTPTPRPSTSTPTPSTPTPRPTTASTPTPVPTVAPTGVAVSFTGEPGKAYIGLKDVTTSGANVRFRVKATWEGESGKIYLVGPISGTSNIQERNSFITANATNFPANNDSPGNNAIALDLGDSYRSVPGAGKYYVVITKKTTVFSVEYFK